MYDNKREYGIDSLQNLGELGQNVVVGLDPCYARRDIAGRGILRMMVRGWRDDMVWIDLIGLEATSDFKPFETRARFRASCWQRGRQAPLGPHLRKLSAESQKLISRVWLTARAASNGNLHHFVSRALDRGEIKGNFGCDLLFNN